MTGWNTDGKSIENTDKLWPGRDFRFPAAKHPYCGMTNPHCAGCGEYLVAVPLGWECINKCVKPSEDKL